MKRTLALVLAAMLAAPLIAYAATIKATLSWTDNSTNEDGFRIERRDDPGSNWAAVGTVAVNVVSYVDQPLVAGQGYCWRVVAYNAVGDSLPSNEVCGAAPATPPAPGGLSVTITVTP